VFSFARYSTRNSYHPIYAEGFTTCRGLAVPEGRKPSIMDCRFLLLAGFSDPVSVRRE
jgi:hypothetical protein